MTDGLKNTNKIIGIGSFVLGFVMCVYSGANPEWPMKGWAAAVFFGGLFGANGYMYLKPGVFEKISLEDGRHGVIKLYIFLFLIYQIPFQIIYFITRALA